MGYITHVKTADLLPTQSVLLLGKFNRVLTAYETGQSASLPFPAVRLIEEEWYIIDGHHRCAIANALHGELDVYVAQHPDDSLPESCLAGDYGKTNDLIEYRWCSIKNDYVFYSQPYAGRFTLVDLLNSLIRKRGPEIHDRISQLRRKLREAENFPQH